MSNQEIRQYECSEIRVDPGHVEDVEGQDKEQGPQKLVGYAARFNSTSEDLGGFREIVKPGAFKGSLGANAVYALANHDRNIILGSTKGGSLKLLEDQYGLRVEITPLDTSTAREWFGLVKAGVIDKMSFAFRVDGKDGEKWLRADDGESIRELHRVKVYDVSIVNQPAYISTNVSARSLEEVRAYGESQLSKDSKAESTEINDLEIKALRLRQLEAEVK